jgi:hypothetical protein
MIDRRGFRLDKKARPRAQYGRVRLRLLVDRTESQGGGARIDSLAVTELKSAWT